jgi:hypothetical protein
MEGLAEVPRAAGTIIAVPTVTECAPVGAPLFAPLSALLAQFAVSFVSLGIAGVAGLIAIAWRRLAVVGWEIFADANSNFTHRYDSLVSGL